MNCNNYSNIQLLFLTYMICAWELFSNYSHVNKLFRSLSFLFPNSVNTSVTSQFKLQWEKKVTEEQVKMLLILTEIQQLSFSSTLQTWLSGKRDFLHNLSKTASNAKWKYHKATTLSLTLKEDNVWESFLLFKCSTTVNKCYHKFQHMSRRGWNI